MSVQPAVQVREGTPTDKKTTTAMTSENTNFQHRKVLNRQNGDAVKILFDIPRPKRVRGCVQNCEALSTCGYSLGLCCWYDCHKELHKSAEESKYTWIMENRLEYNRASVRLGDDLCDPCCCRFQVMDDIETHYFDESMFNHVEVVPGAVDGCTRMCHGMYGDKVAFKEYMCCFSRVVRSIHVPAGQGIDVAKTIMTARDNTRARMT